MSQVESFVLDVNSFVQLLLDFIHCYRIFSQRSLQKAGSGPGSSPRIDCGVGYKLATFHDKFFIVFSPPRLLRLVFSFIFSWPQNFDVQSEPSPRHGFPVGKIPALGLEMPVETQSSFSQLDMRHQSIRK